MIGASNQLQIIITVNDFLDVPTRGFFAYSNNWD